MWTATIPPILRLSTKRFAKTNYLEFSRLTRIFCYVRRYVALRVPHFFPREDLLPTVDLNSELAAMSIIRMTQHFMFPSEFSALTTSGQLSSTSSLCDLNPFSTSDSCGWGPASCRGVPGTTDHDYLKRKEISTHPSSSLLTRISPTFSFCTFITKFITSRQTEY